MQLQFALLCGPGAALSVAPRLSVCLSVRPSVRFVPPIFSKQESHRNF